MSPRACRGYSLQYRLIHGHVCDGKPGTKHVTTQAIGLSRGGETTKIHLCFWARPAVIQLTAGNVSDIRVADELIEIAGPARRLIADRGYDANRLRRTLRSVGTARIIPGRRLPYPARWAALS